jgi:hypothetical protein
MLASPLGARFLSAHSLVGPAEFPERTEPGLVRHSKAFIGSFAAGTAGYALTQHEDELARVAEVLGQRMHRALEKKFEIGPSNELG